jgi:hypothetical protein
MLEGWGPLCFKDRAVSYCRWSSNDHQSDVYVYEGTDGWWHIEVARNRRVPVCATIRPVETFDPWDLSDEACEAREDQEMGFTTRGVRVYIDLPYAGDSLVAETARDCAETLEGLQGLGYVVPQFALDALREEA